MPEYDDRCRRVWRICRQEGVRESKWQAGVGVIAVDRLMAKGTIFGGCNVALVFLSKMVAGNAGVSADEAAKEWAANVIPGITIIPSGTWGVNRAQEGGCTYCAGGG